jgi:hypothetical protein
MTSVVISSSNNLSTATRNVHISYTARFCSKVIDTAVKGLPQKLTIILKYEKLSDET